MSDLNLTHRIAEETADRLVLVPNRARQAVWLAAASFFGLPLLGIGARVLARHGIGDVSGWLAVGLGAPFGIAALVLTARFGRGDRVTIDRTDRGITVEGRRPLRLTFDEVIGVQTRVRGPGIYRLLVEIEGRAPLELLQGPPFVLNRIGADLAAWFGVRHLR